jgi:hypothetical protein
VRRKLLVVIKSGLQTKSSNLKINPRATDSRSTTGI